jgi:hypothetical protein
MESSEGIGINDIIGSTISDNKADVRLISQRFVQDCMIKMPVKKGVMKCI